MATVTTVDRFGRIVIPKETRDQFGLAPGTAVTLVDAEEGVLLKPGAPETPLTAKGGVLVFAGRTTADPETHVRRAREERIRSFLPRRRR